MFKIVLDAGHGINTAGKRCLKSIDPKETREWTLNSRICNKIQNYLTAYEGYSLLRVDDTTGKTDIALETRVKNANKFGANIYISIHHNAGVKGGKGGGIVAYTYTKVDSTTTNWQKDLYNAIITNSETINNDISDLAHGYKLERLYSTDKCALQIAICEMRYFDDVPNIVAISEAMELVRKYSTAESPNFVNGILAEFKKRLEK